MKNERSAHASLVDKASVKVCNVEEARGSGENRKPYIVDMCKRERRQRSDVVRHSCLLACYSENPCFLLHDFMSWWR